MKLHVILDQIDLGGIALPEFQRGYVWNRDQVRSLMRSLYRRYPIGSLLVWVTEASQAQVRGGNPQGGLMRLLLDGQQRITSLYGIIRGRPPAFFDGNPSVFTGLHFHLEDETFEFYAPSKMKGDPLWVDVTNLMQKGAAETLRVFVMDDRYKERVVVYLDRLNAIEQIKNIDLHVEEVTGQDKTIGVVVDIFNQVNSGGTKLSEADLALAKVCLDWPDARRWMRECLAVWGKAGYKFRLEWLLRNVTTILTGDAMFSSLKGATAQDLERALQQAEHAINYLLNVIAGRLGLDHDRVLGGRYAFPVMTRYLVQNGGKFKDAAERDKMLYWYIHAFLWGRFAGATETMINQDLAAIRDGAGSSGGGPGGPVDRLIDQMRIWRGQLQVRPEDFGGSSLGARFYPMLYLLTRVCGAKDWGTGVPLSANLLGKGSALEVHHIFPKALLYRHGYRRAEVNAIANYCFLTQGTNLDIRDRAPVDYFQEVESRFPGALASQWIPMDPALWKVENYLDFLAVRRELLAQAANRFLDDLLHQGGGVAPAAIEATVAVPTQEVAPTSPVLDEELRELLSWVEVHGVPAPEVDYEVVDDRTGECVGTVEMAWPDGVQAGYSEPVAFMLGRDSETIAALNRLGFRVFVSPERLKAYLAERVGLTQPEEGAAS